jgi:hypothetical protein
MKTFTITESQLRALQLGIGKPISELESLAINMVSQQIYTAEIKPKEEPGAENTMNQSSQAESELAAKSKR